MSIADLVAPREGAAGVRWLLLAREPRQALRHELERLLIDGYVLGSCRLRRAKFKPTRKLSAYYDVEVRTPDGRLAAVRPIAVTWLADSSPPPAGEVAELERVAIDRGLGDPFRTLQRRVEHWGMDVLVSPLDARFPNLIPLADAALVARMLHAGEGRQYSVRTIRYRPGQRHVLRYDALGPRIPEVPHVLFAKLYADGHGSRSLGVGRALGEALAAVDPRFAVVSALGYLSQHRALLYRRAPGSPLSSLPPRAAATELRLAGELLRAIHSTTPRLVADKRHTLDGEVRAVARASEHIAALSPPTGATIETILERVRALDSHLPREELTFIHGDFKLDHVWVTPGMVTLLDLDRCCIGDAALDIGKFLADLRWWFTQRGDDLGQAREQFLDGYFGGTRTPLLLRARLYEALLVVKIAARRVSLFDSRWRITTDALVTEAEHVLTALEVDAPLTRVGSRR
jgi:Ser/Thr protein kinase RdoA (MazF antagonist)